MVPPLSRPCQTFYQPNRSMPPSDLSFDGLRSYPMTVFDDSIPMHVGVPETGFLLVIAFYYF